MRVYAVTIKPESPFGTTLKGDTIFGHFCWQVVNDSSLLSGGFDKWVSCYRERPFAVFSSAWPKIAVQEGESRYCLPRPCLPPIPRADLSKKEKVEKRKEDKKKKWLLVTEKEMADGLVDCHTMDDKEIFDRHYDGLATVEKKKLRFLTDEQKKVVLSESQSHNSINRLTMTTGKGFDPYSMDNYHYLPGLELSVFVAVDQEALGSEQLGKGMECIGRFGFGRDASSGLGRFSIREVKEISWSGISGDQSVYTLGPCVPEKGRYQEQYFTPFTRFGRHGDTLVLTGKPFKNPVVMADEGAVFVPEEENRPVKPFIGQGMFGLSKVEERTVCQGYSLYLPLSRRYS